MKMYTKKGYKSGKDNHKWKGGRVNDRGYIRVYCPAHPHAIGGIYVLEHRLVMEKQLGRFLESSELVHHIDGNRSNNSLGNLELTTKGRHNQLFGNKSYIDGYNQGSLDCALQFLIENIELRKIREV